jgi:hypothetical protein
MWTPSSVKFGKTEKTECSDFYFTQSDFNSFRVKSSNELNLKI